MKILLVSLSSNNYIIKLSLYSLFEEMLKSGLDVYTLGMMNQSIESLLLVKSFLNAPKKTRFIIWRP